MANSKENQKNSKIRILETATLLFANYGYHGTTTRMIAKESSSDISTLHYHWGDKIDLFIETLLNMNNQIRELHKVVERKVRHRPLDVRIYTAVDTMADFYFEHPEYASLSYQACFSTNRFENEKLQSVQNDTIDLIQDIAYFAFHLSEEKSSVSPIDTLSIMGLVELLHLYVSGENCFNRGLGFESEEYKQNVVTIITRLFSLLYNQGLY